MPSPEEKLATLMGAAATQLDEDTSVDAPAEPTPPSPPTPAAEPPSAPPPAAPEPAAPPAAAAPAQPPPKSAYEELLSQYGGDTEKVASRYREVTGQNAKLTREIEELRRKLSASPAQPSAAPSVSPAAPPAPAPEVAELDNRLSTLSQEFVTVEQQRETALLQYNQWLVNLDAQIKLLVRSDSDPTIDVAKVKNDLAAANEAKGRYEAYFKDLAYRRQSVITDYRNVEVMKKQTERLLAAEQQLHQSRESDEDQRFDSEVKALKQSWDSTATQAAEAKIPASHRQRFKVWADRAVNSYVHTVGEDGEYNVIEDLAQFADSLADEYLEDLRSAAGTYAQQKTADAALPTAPAQKAPAPPTDEKKKFTSVEDLLAYQDAEWAKA